MTNNKLRFLILKIVIAVMMCAVVVRLADLQLVEGESYLDVSQSRLSSSFVKKAPRGEIFDRYGVPLITNKVCYSLQLVKADLSEEKQNEIVCELVNILDEEGCAYYDTLPISESAPYEFEFEDANDSGSADDEMARWFKSASSGTKITDSMSAEEVMDYYKKYYELEDDKYSERQKRTIIGVRAEADRSGFSWSTPFTVADEVSVEVVTKIKERGENFPNVIISNSYTRDLPEENIATHILGRTGKMNDEEYAVYKEKGYSLNDIVGKQGVEKYAEEYLRGTDGTVGMSRNVNGTDVQVVEERDAVPGNYLVLTIDSELQKTAEESLERNIKQIAESGGKEDKDGGDANAGAVVVLDIQSGDVLASATYPTYNLSEFNARYSELANDPDKPLWNRAVSGLYTPGSTFKPLVAIAALETGAITVDEKIEDKGIYTEYPDYQPRCWIWTQYHTTHGFISVSKALEVSCNYFFYEMGKRLGIDTIDQYASKFGLGELTGIELPEEKKGQAANPDYKKKVTESVTSQGWYGGDTLQAAIGQSYSAFTPVQLANYAATIANGGDRHKVNLIKTIRSSVDGSIIREFKPQVVEHIDISPENLKAVKLGMKDVVEEGSAREIFADYPIEIGGKTGTAQVGSKVSNNALFVAFAPYDNPEIAIAVALEHGVAGANAAYVARDIFDKYFSSDSETADGTDSGGTNSAGLLP